MTQAFLPVGLDYGSVAYPVVTDRNVCFTVRDSAAPVGGVLVGFSAWWPKSSLWMGACLRDRDKAALPFGGALRFSLCEASGDSLLIQGRLQDFVSCVSDPSILTQITEALKQSGARMTKKRAQILAAMGGFDRPVTAEEIRKRAGLPSSDLVTVYRNLEAFEAIKALQRIPLERGTQLFELTAPGEHYHHLICRVCHKAERLDLCVGGEVEDRASARGYTGLAHLLEVYGVCGACADVA